MEMPRPTEHHARLERLVGEWTAEETMHPSPWAAEPRKATGRVTCRMDLDGFFLIEDYRQERDGHVTYRGHGVFGYDAAHHHYTMHWFDAMGGIPEHPATGKWEGSRLVFDQVSPMGHARYEYTFHDDTYDFALLHSRDGSDWSPFVTATYRRAT